MSHLLPETVTVGLFPTVCWLRRSGVDTHLEISQVGPGSPHNLLGELEALIGSQKKPLRKGARIRLLISDAAAAMATLAWQDTLHSPAELRAYASACFERNGQQVGDGWTIQTAFRYFGMNGLAYALPDVWLNSVLELLAARGLRLASVLPVSAAAYWRLRTGWQRKLGRRLVLLREPFRLTTMIYDGRHLLARDVQPVTANEQIDLTRLLFRVGATHRAINRLEEWSAGRQASPADLIADCLPDVVQRQLPRHAWM